MQTMEFDNIKGIFLRYLLMPLITGIMFMVLGAIRKSRPAIKVKHIIVYTLLAAILLALPGFLGFSGSLFNPYWYLVAMFYFLGLGILHVNLMHRYFRKHFDIMWKSILFESLLSITCMLLGGYLFVMAFNWLSKGLGNPYMAASSMSTFVIPLAFYYCYIQFISIPYDIYKTWRYDPDQKPYEFKGVDFDRLMVLNVELSKNAEDVQRFNIKAKTLPTGLTFGDWFFRVVDDYNFKNMTSPIQLTDENGEPFYWIFYVKSSFFSIRKYIDFEKEITANGISENDTIICKRVIHYQEEGRQKQ